MLLLAFVVLATSPDKYLYIQQTKNEFGNATAADSICEDATPQSGGGTAPLSDSRVAAHS